MAVSSLRNPTFVGDEVIDTNGGRFVSLDGIHWVPAKVSDLRGDIEGTPTSGGGGGGVRLVDTLPTGVDPNTRVKVRSSGIIYWWTGTTWIAENKQATMLRSSRTRITSMSDNSPHFRWSANPNYIIGVK